MSRRPRFKVGDKVCAPDVIGLDPFTVCVIRTAPRKGKVGLVETGPDHRVHPAVPVTHLIHV